MTKPTYIRPGRWIHLAISLLLGTLAITQLGGCSRERNRGTGFRLSEGNPKLGQEAFVGLSCHRCHSVEGIDLPEHKDAVEEMSLHLGGEIQYVKSYGSLLTSITNPEHIISDKYKALLRATGDTDIRSAMPDFNDRMTVRQLIDIIAFLDSRYRLLEPNYEDSLYDYP